MIAHESPPIAPPEAHQNVHPHLRRIPQTRLHPHADPPIPHHHRRRHRLHLAPLADKGGIQNGPNQAPLLREKYATATTKGDDEFLSWRAM